MPFPPRLCHRTLNTIPKIPRSAFGGRTTTIFILRPLLFLMLLYSMRLFLRCAPPLDSAPLPRYNSSGPPVTFPSLFSSI